MTRPTVHSMVTQDLGYCCLWFFFSRFRKTGVIAARLGVSSQAIRQNKASCGGCKQAENCMDRKVTLGLTPRKVLSKL
jgi:hypothetical protein